MGLVVADYCTGVLAEANIPFAADTVSWRHTVTVNARLYYSARSQGS
jgi:hypothetical protein